MNKKKIQAGRKQTSYILDLDLALFYMARGRQEKKAEALPLGKVKVEPSPLMGQEKVEEESLTVPGWGKAKAEVRGGPYFLTIFFIYIV